MATGFTKPLYSVADDSLVESPEISETDNQNTSLDNRYCCLSETPSELLRESLHRPHRALGMMEKSLMAQRPSNRAVFFLYGLTGSGKTSTLQHLFNGTKELFTSSKELYTSSKESATSSVNEHIYPLRSDHWGADNLQISFIDSPGFGDTSGVHQDVINVALIQEFVTQHSQLGLQEVKWLGWRYNYIVYPNIVMIVVDVNDERLLGYESRVAKMFKILKQKRLHLIDRKRPNVVIVLTHVCSIPRRAWATRLESKAYFVQLLARRFFKIHVPVVYIENEIEDYELEVVGDFSKLFNGNEQPKNLFNTCIDIMRRSQDEVGIEAVRLFFCTTRAEVSSSIPLNIVSLESISNPAVFEERKEYFLAKLTATKSAFVPTKVTQMIDEYIQSSHDSRNEGKNLDEELYPLKFILIKRGFKKPEDLQSKTLSEIEISLFPYKFNELESWVIYDVFKIKYPVVQKISTNLGHGYDLLGEMVKEKLVLHLESDVPVPPYGFLIPANCQCQFSILEENNFICDYFSNMDQYNESRLAKLDLLNYKELIKFKLFPGFNVIDPKTASKNIEISFVYEKVSNSIEIKRDAFKLAQNFQDHLKDVPDSFDESNQTNVEKFDDLFAKYGCCFVSAVSTGGYIRGKFNVTRERVKEGYFQYLRQWLINIIMNNKQGVFVAEFIQGMEAEILAPYYDLLGAELEWFGGDSRYYQGTLKDISQRQWQSWEESVNYNPVILPLHIRSLPMFHVAAEHNDAIQDAFEKHYLRSAQFSSSSAQTHKRSTWKWKVLSTTRKDESEKAKTNLNDVRFCFSGNSTVKLNTGQIKAMENLHIGDSVLSVNSEGRACFSPVYLWGHLDPDTETEYLLISHTQGEIRVSDNHLVFVMRRENGGVRPIPAGRVCVGDLLQYVCVDVVESVEVLAVSRVKEVGVYSPFTLTSRIVVDGVVCSVFAVPEETVGDTKKAHERGHILMAPLRFGFRSGLCKWLGYQMSGKMHVYCSALEKLYYLFRPLETLFQ